MSNLILGREVGPGGNCQGILDGSSRGQPPGAALRHALQPRRHFGGGHHIEDAVSRRRFSAGRRNLEQAYKHAVDTWAEYDNVGEEPTLLQWGANR